MIGAGNGNVEAHYHAKELKLQIEICFQFMLKLIEWGCHCLLHYVEAIFRFVKGQLESRYTHSGASKTQEQQDEVDDTMK